MNKKYFASLIALMLLASCGSQVTDTEITATEDLKTEAAAQGERETLQNIDEVAMEIEESDVPLETEVPIEEVTQAESSDDMNDDGNIVTLSETYTSPGGEEGVTFTLTLDGDIISNIEVVGDTDNQISQLRQAKFIEEVKAAVEGKTISEAEESGVIGGSSLTTGAFHDALKTL